MADYLTEASFVVELPKSVMDYTIALIEASKIFDDMAEIDDDMREEVLREVPGGEAVMADPVAVALAHDMYTGGCAYAPERCERDGYSAMWFHSDESFPVDGMLDIFAYALKKFDCDEIIGFEWSGTCSKPRTDAYGGGAAVITKKDKKWINTADWLAKTIKSILEAREAK